jgi:short-subunit dehydrogenase
MKETVLITGATGGIGYSLAKVFARENYNLVLAARNQEKLNQIKNKLEREHDIKVKTISIDLIKPTAANEIFEELTKDNIIVDILVNNAGYGDYGLFSEANWERQYNLVQLNIQALMHMTHLFMKPMLQRKKGKILNVASIAAFQPGAYWASYAASKAYVLSFTEALSEEYKNSGVTFFALCPGPTKTGFEEGANMEGSQLFEKMKVATADQVAEFGYKKLMQGRVVAIHGMRNKFLVFASKFAPRALTRKVTAGLHGNK